jgi:hypothetical protein
MKKAFHIVPKPGGECCDFCTAEPIQKLYRCGNFLWQRQSIFPHGSVGEWAACRECAELIDNEKWNSVTERSLRYFLRKHTVPRYDFPILREQFREIHELFRQHRLSEP